MVDRSPSSSARRRGATIAVSVGAAIALALTGVSAASAATPDRVAFPGSVPSWAVATNDAGAPPATTTVEGEIYLPLRNAAAAQALATAVSTPGVGYRLGLSPAQWISRFSPTPATTRAEIAYLKSLGLTISSVPDSRLFIAFRGTVDQVNAAFATTLHSYRYAGTTLLAPSSVPTLPTALGTQVAGLSLDQSRALTRPDSVRQGDIPGSSSPQPNAKFATPKAQAAVPTQCSTYIGQYTTSVPLAYGKTAFSTYNCGYTPAQLRGAYGVPSGQGAGQTVAIVDAYASPTIVSDVNTYMASLGEPGLSSATYSQVVPPSSQFVDVADCGGLSGWQGEQTIDVTAVHAMAPSAHILYVGGYNCVGGIDTAISKILDNKLANIVSNSYGNPGEAAAGDALVGENNLLIQAAGEGIGMYFSSGDNGDEVENIGAAEPDFPASSPWATSVGGTAVGIDQRNRIAFETGWGDTIDQVIGAGTPTAHYKAPLPGDLFGGGAGGGRSTVFAQPWYQRGIVPNSLAQGKRVSPDVASLADPYTGLQIGVSPIDDATGVPGAFELETWGGTSVAAPLVAGQMAVVQQQTHSTIGFANPTLYAIDRVLPSAFRDVLPQNPPQGIAYVGSSSGNTYLVTLDADSSLKTTTKYDDTTGIGALSFSLLTLVGQGRH